MRGLLFCMLAACGDQTNEPARDQVALIPATSSKSLDLLFVLDDSPATLHLQSSLKVAFPALLAELGEMPDIHVGVVTSDLGAQGFDDPVPGSSIGSGPGSCSNNGKAGRLQTNSTPLVQGVFISDVAASDGTRTTNYSTTINDAFSAIASVGSGGCGFEQPLEAMHVALLDPTGFNSGFSRADARLAVIALQDEDDCSFAHSTLLGADVSLLGPLQSFRCTRFGVSCDGGGRTPDEMNVLGDKQDCHSNESSAYVGSIARYRDVLAQQKSDPRDVLFAVIAGPPQPVVVEARTPPGGGTSIPAVRHSCMWQEPAGGEVADPAVRMSELARTVPRGDVESVCQNDLEPAVRSIARQVRTLLGDTCVPVAITNPETCEADEVRTDGTRTPVAFELIEDPACSASGVRVIAHPTTTPSADTMLSLRCAP
jgi:hypothetical protein